MRRTLLLTAIVALLSLTARAQVITFETTPGGATPVDDAPNNVPYNITGGGTVEMYFDNNGNFIHDGGDTDSLFERRGQDGTDGFVNSTSGVNDDPMPGFGPQLGNWFVRQPVNGSVPPPFIIKYNTAQTIISLAGEIWDIDGSVALGTERWRVSILDAANNVLTFQDSPLGVDNTGDSLPWTFTFTGLPLGVDKIKIDFTGTKTLGLGLAFNNFQPATVPEPASICVVVAAAAMLRRRR